MKLLFRKDDESQVHVFNVIDDVENEFSYIEMVKALLKERTMEEPVIEDGFSEAEAESIRSMVGYINEEIAGAVDDEETSDDEDEDGDAP